MVITKGNKEVRVMGVMYGRDNQPEVDEVYGSTVYFGQNYGGEFQLLETKKFMTIKGVQAYAKKVLN